MINDVREDYWGLDSSPFFINPEPRCPHAKQPRTMSASARGLAISRAVDNCCKNLPATPGFSPGATRFLQQWDRATRLQREELLGVLADRLLAGRIPGCPSARLSQQEKNSGPHVDFHRGMDSSRWTHGGGLAAGISPMDNVCPSQAIGNGGERQTRLGDSHSRLKDSRKEVHPVVAVTRTESVVKGAEAEHNPYRGKAQAAAKKTMGTTDVAGFLELLGPHAGLLATRVSSQLRSSYASGHSVGPCLRVCALLAEATTVQSVTGDADDERCNMHSTASSPGMLGQQLCTPEMLSTALEIAAAPPRTCVVGDDSSPKTKSAKRARRRPMQAKTSTTPILFSSPKERDEEEDDRAEALRLLLVLVRLGGRRVKEFLTSPARPLLPHPTEATAAPTLGSGDAFDRIVMALRRPACRSEVRTAGVRLLAELGTENLSHPAGDSCARVWNAVLCLLSGLGDRDPADGHVLGCRIASELLEASPKPPGSRRGPGIDPLLEDSISSQHRERLMRPELMLLPSVLSLSLSDRREVREAAGNLAGLLVTDFPRPCCYLLVACLVGLFGLVSGVDRGAPVAWIENTNTLSSRYGEPVGMQGGDAQNQTARADRSEAGGSGYEHTPKDGCRKTSPRHAVRRLDLPMENHEVCGQTSGAEGRKGESAVDPADRGGAGGRRSAEAPESSFASRERTEPRARGTASHGDKAIFALGLLRRICTAKRRTGDCTSTRLALAYALAPLAALDLILGPPAPASPRAADLFSRDGGDTGDKETDVDVGTVFVTQTEVEAAKVGVGRSDGGPNVAGDDDENDDDDDDDSPRSPRGEENLPTSGPQSMSLDDLGRGCSGGEFRLGAGRRRCGCAQPTEAHCLAVAEALLAMYRGGRGSGEADGGSQEETRDPDGMIDAALDACPTLSRGLGDGDSETMARVFSSCSCRTNRGRGGGGDTEGSRSAELRTLQKNILALTARLGRVRPPPPLPAPPSASASTPAAAVAVSRSGAECDERPGWRHRHRHDDREDGAIGKTTMLPESGRYAETPFPDFSGDRSDDGWRAATGRESMFSGEGPRDWMKPGAEGNWCALSCFYVLSCYLKRSLAKSDNAFVQQQTSFCCGDTQYADKHAHPLMAAKQRTCVNIIASLLFMKKHGVFQRNQHPTHPPAESIARDS